MSHENIEEEEAFQQPDPQGEIKGVNPTFLTCYLI